MADERNWGETGSLSDVVIEDLELWPAVLEIFIRLGYKYAEAITQTSQETMLGWEGFGRRSLAHVVDRLAYYGREPLYTLGGVPVSDVTVKVLVVVPSKYLEVLIAAGVSTIGELITRNLHELLAVPGMNAAMVDRIVTWLDWRGLRLARGPE